MKAFVIDPFEKKVTEVEYDGNYENIYTLISSPNHPVDTFTCVDINNQQDTVFVDDEGLLSDQNTQQFFSINGNILAGKGLVLGTNEEGESVAPSMNFEDFKKNYHIKFHGLMEHNRPQPGFKVTIF